MAPNENSTEKNATITVDSLAEKLFIIPDASRVERALNEYIAELQVHLVDKGDDPCYNCVVFAVHGRDKYVLIEERQASLKGVFLKIPRAWRFPYAPDESKGTWHLQCFPSLDGSSNNTLVVANNQDIAKMWETELQALGYSVRRI